MTLRHNISVCSGRDCFAFLEESKILPRSRTKAAAMREAVFPLRNQWKQPQVDQLAARSRTLSSKWSY